MSVFLQALALFVIGLIIYNGLNALGVPHWVMLVCLLTFLIYFRPIMSAIVRGLYALGDGWPRTLALWLIEQEHLEPAHASAEADVAAARNEQRIRAEVDKRVQNEADKAHQQGRRQALAESLFDAHAETALFLVPEKSPRARSRSRIGGLPRLPHGTDWPNGPGKRLHFLAALYLDELPDTGTPDELPRTGILLFFLDPEEMLTGTVLHIDQEGATDTPVPEDLYTFDGLFEDTGFGPNTWPRTSFRLIPGDVAAPDYEELRQYADADDEREFSYAFQKVQKDAYKAAIQAHSRKGELKPCSDYFENLVGGPKIVSANNDGGSGLQLLRLDSAHEFGLMFGDCGVVEFRIDPEDATQGRWDKVYVISGSC